MASLLVRQQNGTVKDSFAYFYTDGAGVYEPTGHLRREVDSLGQTHAFSYTNLYELETETHPDLGTVTYKLDANGNREWVNRNGTLEYYGYGAGNRLLWVNGVNAAPSAGQTNYPYTLFQYNTNALVSQRERRHPNGIRQVYDCLWDGDDRLRQVNEGATNRFSALYDGDGLRVQKTDTRGGLGLQTHNYSYGPGGLLHEDNPTTVYTPGFGHRSNGVSKFYHVDWLGSTRYTSDSTGNAFPAAMRFDAYGNRSATGGTDPYHSTDLQFAGAWGYQTEWSGGASDPGLGLQYLEQRYYDPAVGRFISPDPIGLAGGLNLYLYPTNPVGGVDPAGLYTEGYQRGLAAFKGRLDGFAAWVAASTPKAKGWVNENLVGPYGAGVGGATVINTGLDVLSGIAMGLAVTGHAGEGQGTDWDKGDWLLRTGHAVNDTVSIVGTSLLLAGPTAGAVGKLRAAWNKIPRGIGLRCRVGSVPGMGELIGEWGAGSFRSAEESAIRHFMKHGNDRGVKAKNLFDFLTKAQRARTAARASGRTGTPVPGETENVRRFPTDNQHTYIDIDVTTGNIISYGGL